MCKSKKNLKNNINGILLLDKPQGITSNLALQKTKRIFNATKAGHMGSLDPLATGILPICFGQATKYANFILDADKTYIVSGRLGIRTNTSDADGEVVATNNDFSFEKNDILKVLTEFTGDISQTPSIFSALKYQGKPYYFYARNNIEIPRVTRTITINSIKLLELTNNTITLEVSCSKGTYIRTLIDDIGLKLGCYAHVASLRRTVTAIYKVSESYSLDNLHQKNLEELKKYLLPIEHMLSHLPKIYLDDNQVKFLYYGQKVFLSVNNFSAQDVVSIFDMQENFLGVAKINNNQLVDCKLMANKINT